MDAARRWMATINQSGEWEEVGEREHGENTKQNNCFLPCHTHARTGSHFTVVAAAAQLTLPSPGGVSASIAIG